MRRALDNRLPVIACVGRELAAAMRADVCRTWDEWDDLRECQCVVTEEQETATILLGVSDCVCVVPEQEQAAWAAGVLRQDEDMQRAAMLRRQDHTCAAAEAAGAGGAPESASNGGRTGQRRMGRKPGEGAGGGAAADAGLVQLAGHSALRMASAGLQRLRKGAQTSRRK